MIRHKPLDGFVLTLELNLLLIRGELLHLLESSTEAECLTCSRLRCRCETPPPPPSADSGLSDEELEGVRSPPPYTLPSPCLDWKPDLVATIDSWIKASTDFSFAKTRKFPLSNKALSKVSLTWPPYPKSVWHERVGREAVEREKRYRNESRNERKSETINVEDFFGYYSKKIGQSLGLCDSN